MKLFKSYDSPTTLSRAAMACGDVVSRLFVPRRSVPRLPLTPENTRSLLLLRLDGIGDNVCSWPALKLLRERLPETRISLAVGGWAAPLYRECPWVDEVIEWDSGLFGLFRGHGPGRLLSDFKIARKLRQRKFSAGIDLRGDWMSILLLRMVAPPIRAATVTRGGARLLTDPLRIADGHEARRTYDTVRAALGGDCVEMPGIKDWLRPDARLRARERLIQAGWQEARPSVALCPLALWPWKQWPAERFNKLAALLKSRLGLQVVWFLENVGQAGRFNPADPVFCGALDEVAAALGLCRLAVSNDSGLMHLAIAAGCRTVQLFGPGDAAHFGHSGAGLAVFHDASCRHYPCTRSGKCANLEQGWCMEKIEVEAVFDACAQLNTEPRNLKPET